MAKTIVGELTDLYVKYGGSRDDLTGTETTAEMLDAIEQIINTGGGLPEVTADDNGKVLSVVNGEWDKAEAQGGNNDFVVIYTLGDTITADKTFADIITAFRAGKNIVAYDDINDANCYHLSYINSRNGLKFSSVDCDSTLISVYTINHQVGDTIYQYSGNVNVDS